MAYHVVLLDVLPYLHGGRRRTGSVSAHTAALVQQGKRVEMTWLLVCLLDGCSITADHHLYIVGLVLPHQPLTSIWPVAVNGAAGWEARTRDVQVVVGGDAAPIQQPDQPVAPVAPQACNQHRACHAPTLTAAGEPYSKPLLEAALCVGLRAPERLACAVRHSLAQRCEAVDHGGRGQVEALLQTLEHRVAA